MTRAEYMKQWREAHREQLREYNLNYQKKWRAIPKNRDAIRKASLAYYFKHRDKNIERSTWYNVKKFYGLSKEQFTAILESQHGCAICGVEQCATGKRFHIDHCHISKLVRGLLCEECNTLLGKIEKKPGWIEKAMSYLADPPAPKIVVTHCSAKWKPGWTKKSA